MIRRIGEVVRTIVDLVQSVEQLKSKNDFLTRKVDELRREVDHQTGQVTVLLEFVRTALDDKVERRAEAAARAVLAELEAKSSGPSPPRKRK
jgi:uncharacterized protein YoxC